MATATATLARKPLWMQAASGDSPTTYGLEYDGYMMRLLIGAVWPRTGIVTDDAMKITQRAAGAGWFIDIARGFVIAGVTDGTQPDKYLVYQSDNPLTVALTGFNTNPAATRTHKVWLSVFDKQKMSAGTIYEAQIQVTEDTGSGAPTPTSALFPGLATTIQLGSFTITTGQASVLDSHITNAIRHANFGGSHSSITLDAAMVDASATLSIASPKVIRSGTTAKLQGGIRRSSLANYAASTTYNLGTVSPAYAPASPRYLEAAGSGEGRWRLRILTSGSLAADIPAGYTPSWLSLDGITYELD